MAEKTMPSARNSKEAEYRLEDVDQQSITPTDEQVIWKGYWTSTQFMGSALAIILLGNTLFFGYAVPVSSGLPGIPSDWRQEVDDS